MSRLEYYGGEGFGGQKPRGEFLIKFHHLEDDTEHERKFILLSEARHFYDSLKCSKAFWDLTYGAELIDAYTEIEDEK